MGSNQSKLRASGISYPIGTIAPMGNEQTRRRTRLALRTRRTIPDLQFRVLIIGRANAGKTSILQRVCDTTESPTIYRGGVKVSSPDFCP